MTIKPGQGTELTMRVIMHGDMGGPHHFRVHLHTNDPAQPEVTVSVLSNWVP
jgi:hypothetical protein